MKILWNVVGEHSGDMSHSVPAPGPRDFWESLSVSHWPSRCQLTDCLQVLRLTLAMSKTCDGFRQGCRRTKVGGGMMSTKPLQEQGEMLWGKGGHPRFQNHLAVKNNQCLVLPVDAPGKGKELLAAHHLSSAKQEQCPPLCISRPLQEAPAALEIGHRGITRSHSSPWDARVEKPTRTLLDPIIPTKCASSPRDTGTAEVASRPSPAPPLHSPLQIPWILRTKAMTTSPAGRTSRSRGCS